MSGRLRDGDCARLPDGRAARVRGKVAGGYKVRVRRKTSNTHEFLTVKAKDLERINCPDGWMSPDGYRRYLRVTLKKMRARQAAARRAK